MAGERKKPVAVLAGRERGDVPLETPEKTGKLEPLTDLMTGLIQGEFTGYLKINFSQGGISRVEKFEEISKKLDK
jgi:hypothetical protein